MLEVPACSSITRCAVNAPGSPPSPWLVPAALLRRHAVMLALATLPLLVFGAHAVSRPSPSPPVVPTLIQTEGVTVRRMDEGTFRVRWMPVNDMPASTVREVHYLVVGGEEVVGAVSGAAIRTAPPSRHRLRTRPAGLDICQRHGMRRVDYGKRWRCRR